MTQNDDDYVMVQYTHPNLGVHGVVGANTKTNYGYRSGGEQFLVHKADIAAQPQFYRPITSPVFAHRPTTIVESPPPPPVLKAEPPLVAKPMVTELEESHPVPQDIQRQITDELDLQLLPGVTPTIERGLKAAGFTTAAAILDAGVEGLTQVKFVGDARAQAVYDYVKEKYGTG